jgi:transcriptional regulator with XRE-family HTH domain
VQCSPITEAVPTRPNQNNPERVARWEQSRQRVGANIRRVRTERGMTQEALALRSGVTRNVLIDVEFGRRGLLYERLFDIADALTVSVCDLMEKRGHSSDQDRGTRPD